MFDKLGPTKMRRKVSPWWVHNIMAGKVGIIAGHMDPMESPAVMGAALGDYMGSGIESRVTLTQLDEVIKAPTTICCDYPNEKSAFMSLLFWTLHITTLLPVSS